MESPCPKCGRANGAERRVCYFCGTAMVADVSRAARVVRGFEAEAGGSQRNVDAARRAAAWAALIPGAGHFLVRAPVRGALFFLVVGGMVALGLSDIVGAVVQMVDRLSQLEMADSAVSSASPPLLRAFLLCLAASLLHLFSIWDAYRAGLKKS